MSDQTPNINDLEQQLRRLLQRQADFQREIEQLRRSIDQLKGKQPSMAEEPPIKKVHHSEEEEPVNPKKSTTAANVPLEEPSSGQRFTLNIERFIGENLMNKVGILILVFGIAFGIQYAIENEWISPLVRIILGYLVGLVMVGIAIRLKAKYHRFSAVILGGALAIIYFTTFAAYQFYHLLAFLPVIILMILTTCVGVFAALRYQEQIIALLGLVGAYGIPYLLGDAFQSAGVFLAYIGLVNFGILLVAFRQYWKLLHHFAFWLTWTIFITWYFLGNHFTLIQVPAMLCTTLYFLQFYALFLGYKLHKREAFKRSDVVLMLANAFIFYGIGYDLVQDFSGGPYFLGLYTIAIAAVHFGVGWLIRSYEGIDRRIYLLVFGLALVFLIIAVPVQLDGSWVTLIWTFGALLLAVIGNYAEDRMYRQLVLPLSILAFISLGIDWSNKYTGVFDNGQQHTLFFNIYFLTGVLFAAAMGAIAYIDRKVGIKKEHLTSLTYLIPPLFLLASAYLTPALEISYYWNQRMATDLTVLYELMKHYWLLNYSLVFIAALHWINLYRVKNQNLGLVLLVASAMIIGAFLTTTLTAYSLQAEDTAGYGYLLAHYLSYLLLGVLFWSTHRSSDVSDIGRQLGPIFDLVGFFLLLWIVSLEWLFWMNDDGSLSSSRLGLSIIWGVFAAIMIAIGIGQRKRHLRIGAMVLFGIILLKLFFYDLAQLNNISKTIVLVALGGLLLGASFLYNKYKVELFQEE